MNENSSQPNHCYTGVVNPQAKYDLLMRVNPYDAISSCLQNLSGQCNFAQLRDCCISRTSAEPDDVQTCAFLAMTKCPPHLPIRASLATPESSSMCLSSMRCGLVALTILGLGLILVRVLSHKKTFHKQ